MENCATIYRLNFSHLIILDQITHSRARLVGAREKSSKIWPKIPKSLQKCSIHHFWSILDLQLCKPKNRKILIFCIQINLSWTSPGSPAPTKSLRNPPFFQKCIKNHSNRSKTTLTIIFDHFWTLKFSNQKIENFDFLHQNHLTSPSLGLALATPPRPNP